MSQEKINGIHISKETTLIGRILLFTETATTQQTFGKKSIIDWKFHQTTLSYLSRLGQKQTLIQPTDLELAAGFG